jgi:hypothetical protein
MNSPRPDGHSGGSMLRNDAEHIYPLRLRMSYALPTGRTFMRVAVKAESAPDCQAPDCEVAEGRR